MKKTIDEISQWLKSELAISLQNEEYERASGIKKALEKIENGDRPLASPPDDLNLVIDFRLITKESEIKNTDFVIIYYIKEYDQTELDDWNIQEIQGKKYIIIPFIGIYESFLKEWERNRKLTKSKNKVIFINKVANGTKISCVAYRDVKSLINDCSVYTYPYRVSAYGDDAIFNHINNNNKLGKSKNTSH